MNEITLTMKYYQSPQPEIFIKIRKELKMSQGRLARQLKVNKSTISRIEQGKQCPKPNLIGKLIRLREKFAPYFKLGESPEVNAILARLNHEPAFHDLSQNDLEHLSYRFRNQLRKDKKQLRFLRNKLETALMHHTLDEANLSELQRWKEHFENVEAYAVEGKIMVRNEEYVAQNVTTSAKAYRRKRAWALDMTPYEEMELREEIRLLESRIEQRQNRIAEIGDLLQELEEDQSQQVATAPAMAETPPRKPELQVSPAGELNSTQPLRDAKTRNVAPATTTQRCAEPERATLRPVHRQQPAEQRGSQRTNQSDTRWSAPLATQWVHHELHVLYDSALSGEKEVTLSPPAVARGLVAGG